MFERRLAGVIDVLIGFSGDQLIDLLGRNFDSKAPYESDKFD